VSDEGFREIQLNGKQLVFMFMAVTVVLVVTFLFGVLVGRGAREGTEPAQIASSDVAPDQAAAPVADKPAPPPVAGSSTAQTPAAPAEELSYAERLLRDTPPAETLKPATDAGRQSHAPAPVVQEPVVEKAPPPRSTVAPAERPVAVPPVPRSTPATSVPAPIVAAPATDPSGPGFAVQVAAYRDRRDADTLAKQLTAKGYPAFVMDPVKGTSTALFRVRVGKYKTLKDAEAIETRLQTAEQLTNAWIAR
jgi:cell division septation protein DedD